MVSKTVPHDHQLIALLCPHVICIYDSLLIQAVAEGPDVS